MVADGLGVALQMMNSNPEIASMLNNPEVMRDSLRMASNPVRDDLLPLPAPKTIQPQALKLVTIRH